VVISLSLTIFKYNKKSWIWAEANGRKYAKTKAARKTQSFAVVSVVAEDITKSIKILFPAIKLPKVK